MKLLTLNFLTCATKDCRAAAAASTTATMATPTNDGDGGDEGESRPAPPFPLRVRDAELARLDLDFQPLFWRNLVPRIDWPAMRQVVASLGLALPQGIDRVYPAAGAGGAAPDGDVGMADADADAGESAAAGPALVKVGGEGIDDAPEEALDEETLRALHDLLLETQVQEGALECARCGHRYAVKEGIANFLLPPHLV